MPTCKCQAFILEELELQTQKTGGTVIEIMQDIQDHYRYLPQKVLRELSRLMEVPLSRIVSISTFYKAFTLVPRGRCPLRVCLGTACHVSGAPRVLERLESELGIKAGEGVTKDGLFSIDAVRCVGACSLAPTLVAGDITFGKITPGKVSAILDELRGQYESASTVQEPVAAAG